MSQEQLKKFIEEVNQDKALQQKVVALHQDAEAAIEQGVEIARAAGFNLDKDDLKQMLNSVELNDCSLDSVAGGKSIGML